MLQVSWQSTYWLWRRFVKVLILYGHDGGVVWPGPREQTFVPPPHECSTWNLTSISQVVSEEKMFENVDRRQTTTDTSHTISSPESLWLRGATNKSDEINEKILTFQFFLENGYCVHFNNEAMLALSSMELCIRYTPVWILIIWPIWSASIFCFESFISRIWK